MLCEGGRGLEKRVLFDACIKTENYGWSLKSLNNSSEKWIVYDTVYQTNAMYSFSSVNFFTDIIVLPNHLE